MKFESKLGVGEICIYNDEQYRGERRMPDLLVKVVAVTFDIGGSVGYLIEVANDKIGIQRIQVHESSLTGDPLFNQESGCYDKEVEDNPVS